MSNKDTDESWDRGIAMVDQVYGPGVSEMMQGMQSQPFVAETVRHVFGEIWSRPGLSMRDKRLLVIGATAMLGRSDLIAIQVAGAIHNGELSDAQLDEIPLLMLFYAGAGNSTAVHRGIATAQSQAKGKAPAQSPSTKK